ncbi:MAG: hypothetical protein AAGA54_17640 [Myxococcota bacterium]
MSPEDIRALLIPPHGVFGMGAIVAGIVALSVTKGPGAHPWAGRTFMVMMVGALVLAAPVAISSTNLFLIGVLFLVAYHMAVAWRLARVQPPRRPLTTLDRNIHLGFGLVFVTFGAYGVVSLARGASMGIVAVVLAGISLFSVRGFHRFTQRDDLEEGEWVQHHVRGVAASFIASLTAFLTVIGPRYFPQVPGVVLWLAPTALFTPVFSRLSAPPDA